MHPILTITGVSKNYGKLTALDAVSFEVPAGAVFGILGPNGSGKTTLLSIILDVLHADTGKFSWFGNSPQTNNRKQIGSLLETPNFYHYLSAVDNLKITQAISGRGGSTDIDEVLRIVKLDERKNSKFSSYSLGMKQRLAIGAALLGNPNVLVFDEPTNGLDPQGIADIRNLILHLSREQGKTVLVSSHLLSEIEQVATRLIIIDKGCKLVEGDSKELFDTSKTVVAIQTLDNKQATELLLQSSWAAQLLVNRSTDKEIFMQLDEKHLPSLHKNLVEMGIGVLSVKPMHSLEDYFLRITSTPSYV